MNYGIWLLMAKEIDIPQEYIYTSPVYAIGSPWCKWGTHLPVGEGVPLVFLSLIEENAYVMTDCLSSPGPDLFRTLRTWPPFLGSTWVNG